MKNLESFIREEFEDRFSQLGISFEKFSDISYLIEISNKHSSGASWREVGMLLYNASKKHEEYKENY